MYLKSSLITLFALFSAFTGTSFLFIDHPAIENKGRDTLEPVIFTVTGVGDMMFGTSFPSTRYLPPHDDPSLLLGPLADTLRASGITFGNLEGSFLDQGEPFKKCRDTNICYLFRMPEKYASVLSLCGFDLLSLANNHFGDFGWPAAVRTRKILDSLKIHYSGNPENSFTVIEIDTVRFGFCAFSPTAGAIDINDREKTSSVVRSLARTCDVVIVSFHGGAEGIDYQRVTRNTEIFYGESRGNVYEFAHHMIDCGADIIFGHGPHVPRAIELYRERLICYSLGNFCTYGRFNINGPNGIAPIIKVNIDASGKFLTGRIIPAYQDFTGVKYDPLKRAVKKIKELTSLDFPETELVITEEGNIFIKK